MNLNFKNILAGVGGVATLAIIAILGIFSKADYFNSDLSSIENSPTGKDLICDTNVYEKEYEISTIPPSPPGSPFHIANSSIEIDINGNIIFPQQGESESLYTIKQYFTESKRWYYWQKQEAGNEIETPLYSPVGVDVAPDGTVFLIGGWIDDNGYLESYRYIYKFSADGVLQKKWGDVWATAVVASANEVFALSTVDPKLPYKAFLKKYDYDGNSLGKIGLPEDDTTVKTGECGPQKKPVNTITTYEGGGLDNLTDMAINKNGIIHIPMNNVTKTVNTQYCRSGVVLNNITYQRLSGILRYNTSLGKLDTLFAKESSPVSKYEDLVNFKPNFDRINIDNNGNIYVTTSDSKLKKYNSNGDLIKEWVFDNDYVVDIATDKDGNLYIKFLHRLEKHSEVCGKLTIKKIVEPTSSTRSFAFSKNFLDKKDFTLEDDGTNKNNSVTYTFFKPSKDQWYTVSETPFRDYETYVSCDDPSGDSKPGLLKEKGNVIQSRFSDNKFEEITCTFTNEQKYNNEGKGTLIIKKDTIPNTDEDFSFEIDSLSGGWADGGYNKFTLSDGGTKVYEFVDTNFSYTINEIKDDSNDLLLYGTSMTCTDKEGNSVPIEEEVDTFKAYKGKISFADKEKIDTITCTVKNFKQSKITIIKDITPDNEERPDLFNFKLESKLINYCTTCKREEAFSLSDYSDGTKPKNNKISFYTYPGIYNITETIDPTRYEPWYYCKSPSSEIWHTILGSTGKTKDIYLYAGEETICTFDNKSKLGDGKITIIKDTEPNKNFVFNFTLEHYIGINKQYEKKFELVDDGKDISKTRKVFLDLPYGAYYIKELNFHPDYDLEITCIDAKGKQVFKSQFGSGADSAYLKFDDNTTRDVTCTFKNKCIQRTSCGVFNPETPSGGGFQE